MTPANDTTSAALIVATARAYQTERRRTRILQQANELAFYARELGREVELQASIDAAWLSLGVAAAEAERAEVELVRAKRRAR